MEVASRDNYFGFILTGPKVVVGFLNGVKMVRDDFDQVLLHFRSFENSLTGDLPSWELTYPLKS